jgi:protein-disulfide isomerase
VLKNYCSLDKVCVVYHEFLLQGHEYSRQAALYSKAAQRLGRKQWLDVMEALYENQERWYNNGSMDDVVFKALGADEYFKLRRMLLDPSIDSAIEGEIAMGPKNEVTATPTMFVNAIGKEQKVVGGLPYPVLKGFFDSIVK